MTLYQKIKYICKIGRFSEIYLAKQINIPYGEFIEKATRENFTEEELDTIRRVFKESW